MVNDMELWTAAETVKQHAYAPYSRFAVGAAVQTRSGQVFSGCNVENSSFGLTSCAERNAIYAAIAAGERELVAIAVVGSEISPTFPCGACRQVMAEFGVQKVIVGTPRQQRAYSLAELLPAAFSEEQIK